MSKSTDNISSTCPLCFHPSKLFAIGPCNHRICYVCSTRMRVLVKQMYCAVCRGDVKQVIFTSKQHLFEGIITHRFPRDRDFGIAFENNNARVEYRKLLQHKCSLCTEKPTFKMFKELQDHMRKEHERFYCDLCVKNTHVFTSERKFYSRKELAEHRRKGDADDTSYRGHPLCEFCDERYFDNDALLKHLRIDHFFCHFCEADGISNQFYGEYSDLREHFREKHYLCEEPECCEEQFSNAFRSSIDLKAHKAQYHFKNLSKQQARQNRQIEVDIQLPPRVRERDRDRRDGGYVAGRGRASHLLRDNSDTARAIEASLLTEREERISRSKKQKENPKEKSSGRRKKVGANGDMKDSQNVEVEPVVAGDPVPEPADFPTLSGAAAAAAPEPALITSWRSQPPVEADFPTLTDTPQPVVPSQNWRKNEVRNKTNDFPTLTGTSQPVIPAQNWRKNEEDKSDDYPVLPSSKATKKQKKTAKSEEKQNVTNNTWNQPKSVVNEDFPSLSGSSRNPPQRTKKKEEKPLQNNNEKTSNLSKPREVSQPPTPAVSIANQTRVTSHDLPPKPIKPALPPGFSAADEDFPSLSSIATLLGTNKKADSKKTSKYSTKTPISNNHKVNSTTSEKTMAATLKQENIPRSVPAPPPGFNSVPTGPPPGFTNLLQAPPGFVQKPPDSFAVPDNYQERNKELVRKIQKFLRHNPLGFDQFRDLSGQYRTNMISAVTYYNQCYDLLGENFTAIFSELVSLLPDIDKQQELLTVHNDRKIASKEQTLEDVAVIKISKKSNNKKTAWGTTAEPRHNVCPYCRQSVLKEDYDSHLNNHQDFPALGSSKQNRASVSVASAWGR